MNKIYLSLAIALGMAVTTLNAEEAKVNFSVKCAGCHGKEGKGDTAMGQKMGARDFTDPKVQATLKEEECFKAIKEGLKKDEKVLMRPFAEKLTDAEIKALVAYVRALAK
jgi:cytochrome c553